MILGKLFELENGVDPIPFRETCLRLHRKDIVYNDRAVLTRDPV